LKPVESAHDGKNRARSPAAARPTAAKRRRMVKEWLWGDVALAP
jgi:hypothetical protein